MGKQHTYKWPYTTSLQEVEDAPGTFIFTFVPKGGRQEHEPGSASTPVPRYVVVVREQDGAMSFDWCGQPPNDLGSSQAEFEKEARNRLTQRQGWIKRISELVATVEQWAKELGWSTRRIEKKIEDARIGNHKAPALLLQEATVRALLEPISRSAPGSEGLVDLYLLPGYDDIASLYFREREWHIHYLFPRSQAVAAVEEAEVKSLSKETLAAVLEKMKKNGQ
jgi:hypothetical protein